MAVDRISEGGGAKPPGQAIGQTAQVLGRLDLLWRRPPLPGQIYSVSE
jgi:hypothetical protein